MRTFNNKVKIHFKNRQRLSTAFFEATINLVQIGVLCIFGDQ